MANLLNILKISPFLFAVLVGDCPITFASSGSDNSETGETTFYTSTGSSGSDISLPSSNVFIRRLDEATEGYIRSMKKDGKIFKSVIRDLEALHYEYEEDMEEAERREGEQETASKKVSLKRFSYTKMLDIIRVLNKLTTSIFNKEYAEELEKIKKIASIHLVNQYVNRIKQSEKELNELNNKYKKLRSKCLKDFEKPVNIKKIKAAP